MSATFPAGVNKRLILWPLFLLAAGAALWLALKWSAESEQPVGAPIAGLEGAIFRLQVAASNRIKPTTPTRANPPIELDLKEAVLTEALLQDLGQVTTLRTLSLAITNVKDADLKHVQKLTNLEELYLGSKQITDKAIESLKPLQRLKFLDLGDTSITDAALPLLRDLPNLEQLYLANTAITNAGLEHLQDLPKLRLVYLDNTPVTAAGLDRLQAKVPMLQVFGNPRE